MKQRITDEMQQAAEELEFERAARCRDRLAALSAIQGVQGINTQSVEEADVFALDEQAGQFCVEVFFFRNWQNWGNRAYFPKADKSMSREEVLGSFLAQFYDDKPAPRLVLLSHEIEDAELMAAALSTRAEARVEIHAPQRGERRQLIEYVLRNAREALGRRLADTASQQKLLVSLGQAFGLPKAPRRVEVYDNSHIMGTNAVGAMVVAGRERLHEAALPHLQHAVGGPEARRRLRHDARDAAAPLRPAGQGGAESGRRRRQAGWRRCLSRLARPGPDRRRQGAAGGGAPGPGGGGRQRERRRR